MIQFTLKGPATPWSSRRLTKAAMSILAESLDEPEMLHDLNLALTEATANVVRHAYRDCDPGELDVRLTLHPFQAIELEISDWGPGFRDRRDCIANAEPEAQGGRGLFIMSRLADVFDIRRRDGKNTVYLLMNIGRELWRHCG